MRTVERCVFEVGQSISWSWVVEILSLSLWWVLYGYEAALKACCDEHQKTKQYGVRFVAAITLLP